jgi:amino-acid N-acetyltransferase
MAKQNETLLGVCGLEQYKTEAILRSFVVSEYSRNKGIGKAIYQFTISKAAELGIKSLVLLTTTADTWFKKHHWNVIDRNTVSQSLAESAEFNSICPQCHLHAT